MRVQILRIWIRSKVVANVLDKIIEDVRGDLAVREAKISCGEIKKLSLKTPSPIDTVAALARPGVQVTAGVKCASLSKGELADIPLPDILAAGYEQGGAVVIPYLTEERRFHGSLVDLGAVRRAVNIPVLRRDFIITPYRVHEAHTHGADLVLPMCPALDQPALEFLLDRTESLGTNALVEVHITEEVERVEATGAKILDISVRNLKTLDVDLSIYERLAPVLPDHIVKVAESGVKGPEELHYYVSHDADAVLVGEGLVTADEPGEVCQRLVIIGIRPTLRSEQ